MVHELFAVLKRSGSDTSVQSERGKNTWLRAFTKARCDTKSGLDSVAKTCHIQQAQVDMLITNPSTQSTHVPE